MRNPLRSFGIRMTTGHTVWAAALAPLGVMLVLGTRHQRWGIGLVAALVVVVLISYRGRRSTEWIAAIVAWLWRHRRSGPVPSEPVVGATVMPGDHVAVRWQDEVLVALVELLPRSFTPTVVVDGRVHTDDVLDTQAVERLLSVHCPDLEADIVSSGYRVGPGARPAAVSRYEQLIGTDPAPAYRRTWVVVRADPRRAARSAQRRDAGVPGLLRYLVASTTRVADGLAREGVDAICSRSFDDFDQATAVSFVREKWSRISGDDGFTTAYTAPGGPDTWWSVPAERTTTHVRVAPGTAPCSTVLLTTTAKPRTPRGFSRVLGAQRGALHGQTVVSDRHWQLPIGSAGVLMGETANRHRVYLPFDDVDASLDTEDGPTFTRFVLRAHAAGGAVTLAPPLRELAELIGAATGAQSKVAWPHATTYLEPHPGVEQVLLRHNQIGTSRHPRLPIRAIPDQAGGRHSATHPRPLQTTSARGD